jgi:hypothetical protein
VPEGRPLNFKQLNARFNDFAAQMEPRIEKGPGRITYRWGFKDIPQIIPEAQMPPMVEVNPSFLLSSFNSWQEVYNWWWSLAKSKIAPDAALKDKVAELTAGVGSLKGRARAIYDFCAKEIRYVAVEYGDAGYEPHAAAEVLRNKYGDCKDQSVLLVAMLREAGVKAWPVVISTRDYYDAQKDFASMLFNHVIAAAAIEGQMVYMDPTAETCAFGGLPAGDQGRTVLLCREEGYSLEKTPVYPAQSNRLTQSTRIRLSADEEVSAERSMVSAGIYAQAQRYWLLYTQPKLIEETLREKIQESLVGGRLIDYKTEGVDKLTGEVALSYRFSGKDYLTCAGPLRLLPQLSGVNTSLAAREERRYDIDFGACDEQQTFFEIELPPGLVVEYMPEGIEANEKWFSYKASYSSLGSKVVFRQQQELKQERVPAEEYPAYKAAVEKLAKTVKQRMVLRKVK